LVPGKKLKNFAFSAAFAVQSIKEQAGCQKAKSRAK
jgi:hypothetical protein